MRGPPIAQKREYAMQFCVTVKSELVWLRPGAVTCLKVLERGEDVKTMKVRMWDIWAKNRLAMVVK